MRFEGPGKRTLELVFGFVNHLSTSIETSTLIPLLGVRGQSAFWGAWKTHPASLLFVLGYVDYIIDENSMISLCLRERARKVRERRGAWCFRGNKKIRQPPGVISAQRSSDCNVTPIRVPAGDS